LRCPELYVGKEIYFVRIYQRKSVQTSKIYDSGSEILLLKLGDLLIIKYVKKGAY